MDLQPKKVIFLSMIICYIGFGVIIPILAPLIREIGLQERHAGIVISIAALVLLLAAPFWGIQSDRIGRKKVMVIGFVGFSFSLAFFAFLGWMGMKDLLPINVVFILLLSSRIMFGFFFPAISSSSQALMADITSVQERSAGMAMIGAATGIGFIIGPALGALLSTINLIFPVIITAILAFIAVILIAIQIPKAEPTVVANKRNKIKLTTSGLRSYLLIATSVMSMIVMLQVTSGFFIQDRFSLDSKETAIWVGIGMFAVGIMMALVQMTIIQKRQYSPRRLVRIGLPILLLGFVLLIEWSHLAGFVIAFMLFGIGGGFLMSGYTAGISLAVGKENQGAAGGLTAVATGIGSLVAPIVGTELYRIHPDTPYWICITINLLLIIFVYSSHKGLVIDHTAKKETNDNKASLV